MNTREALTIPERATSLGAGFNQDITCFSIGLEDGFAGMFIGGSTSLFFQDASTKLRLFIMLVLNTDPCEVRVQRSKQQQ